MSSIHGLVVNSNFAGKIIDERPVMPNMSGNILVIFIVWFIGILISVFSFVLENRVLLYKIAEFVIVLLVKAILSV